MQLIFRRNCVLWGSIVKLEKANPRRLAQSRLLSLSLLLLLSRLSETTSNWRRVMEMDGERPCGCHSEWNTTEFQKRKRRVISWKTWSIDAATTNNLNYKISSQKTSQLLLLFLLESPSPPPPLSTRSFTSIAPSPHPIADVACRTNRRQGMNSDRLTVWLASSVWLISSSDRLGEYNGLTKTRS